MNLLNELRQLDINNAGNWPIAFKVSAMVILFIVIMIAGYFFIWEEQIKTLEDTQAQEETLKTTYLAKKRSAVN